jgi:predicted nucleic acid-binding protein
MSAVVVDSNVLPDLFTHDRRWLDWSSEALARAAETSRLVPFLAGRVFVLYRRRGGQKRLAAA